MPPDERIAATLMRALYESGWRHHQSLISDVEAKERVEASLRDHGFVLLRLPPGEGPFGYDRGELVPLEAVRAERLTASGVFVGWRFPVPSGALPKEEG